jgi:hypothetical protein
MSTLKNLLILERSSGELKFEKSDGAYVLEGTFGEIDKKNRNNRIYTEDEYLPQIEALQDKIKSSKLLGELDHPQNFDVSLKNVSHIIEELHYDKESKQVRGKIRLLDTEAGRQAKALVDAGVPLQISSRAAGTVESNGTVKIKQLFTYDLVADPGFENAELKRVNESYGFDNNDNLFIYDIEPRKELLTTENKTETKMAESKFVSVEDFNKYSAYLSEEIKGLKETLSTFESSEGIQGEVENLKEYSTYLAKKLDESIEYANYLAENVDKNITANSELNEKVERSIEYTEHVAEATQAVKDYTNYLAESYNEGALKADAVVKYAEYLKENLEKVTEYAEYVAETVNNNLILEDGEEAGLEPEEKPVDKTEKEEFDGEEMEDAKDRAEDKAAEVEAEIVDGEEGAKEVVESEESEEEVAEEETEATEESEETEEVTEEAEEAEETTEESEETEEVAEESEETEEVAEEEKEEDHVEEYKNSITEKLQALIEKAEAKTSKDPHFFRFINEAKKEEFNSLSKEDQAKVTKAVEGKGFLTESQIATLWNSSLVTDEATNEPNVITMMPKEYKDKWETLSESKKKELLAQSKYHRLETHYQVRNFWQTRDLRDNKVVMEKVELVKESKEATKELPYNLEGIQESIAKKFKK